MRKDFRFSITIRKLLFLFSFISIVASASQSNNVYISSNINKNIEQNKQILLTLAQNQYLIPEYPLWQNGKIKITSFSNFDIIPKTMQKTLPGEEKSYFALSNIGLSIDAKISKMLSTHASIVYYKSNKGQGNLNKNTGIMLDDAYFTFANFNKAPFFIQGGRFYLPFGDYDRFSIEPSLSQVLSIARAEGIKAGLVNWHGLTTGVYVTNGQLKNKNSKIQGAMNYGAFIHYQWHNLRGWHIQTNLDYIYNMLNVNALAESDSFNAESNHTYTKPIPGIATKIAVSYKFLTLFGRYVSALKPSQDLVKSYSNPATRANPIYGAKPSAWDLGTMIHFNIWNKPSHIDFTYSHSADTAGLIIFNTLPDIYPMSKRRYTLGYTVEWNKHFYTTLEWGHNWLYQCATASPSRQGDNATIRLGIKF